jgi:hypothetical protein
MADRTRSTCAVGRARSRDENRREPALAEFNVTCVHEGEHR